VLIQFTSSLNLKIENQELNEPSLISFGLIRFSYWTKNDRI